MIAVQRWNLFGFAITIFSVLCAVAWAFPLYWGASTSLKPENEVIRPYVELWPDTLTFDAYIFALTQTKIGYWYINSLVTAGAATLLTVTSGVQCGYAISQLRFPGRLPLYWIILASFMVPTQALII